MRTNTLETIIINPDGNHQASVIWMHGLGADGNDFVDLLPMLKLPKSLGIKFIFPHAPIIPVTLNAGFKMRAWFDIYSLTNPFPQDEQGIRNSQQLINDLISKELALGIPSTKILLAGFSQGGAMALHCGLRFQQKLAGILVLSGFLLLEDKLTAEINAINNSTPILMIHGKYDNVIPLDWALHAKKILEQQNIAVEYSAYPMQHEVCVPEIHEISTWLQNIFKK